MNGATEAGNVAEDAVVAALIRDGWALRARNWRGGGGEIDAIVERHGRVRIVEVKLRDHGDPLADEAVTPAKQARLRLAARAWLVGQPEPVVEVCFLVAVVDPSGAVCWIDNAFDG